MFDFPIGFVFHETLSKQQTTARYRKYRVDDWSERQIQSLTEAVALLHEAKKNGLRVACRARRDSIGIAHQEIAKARAQIAQL